MVELADTRDLKSLDGDIVPVRPRLAAPVESLDAQVAFGAFALLRLFPRACGGFRFVSASRTEPGRSPRPRRSLFFCLIARADGAQLFVGGSESSASTRKSRSGLSFCSGFFPALAAGSGLSALPGLSPDAVRVQGAAFSFILSPAPLLPAAAGAGERGENRGGAS